MVAWSKISRQTIINGLKHLEEHGLINRIKGKQGEADKIYVHEAEVEHSQTVAKYTYCDIFPNLEKYASDSEIESIQKILDSLAFSKRDFYKIGDNYVSVKEILNHILSLDTGDVAMILEKMRNSLDIENKFMYLMTALYNF